ncbi:MAG: AMP-binding protein [Oscillospiraceae bacterium]|nr:AMP-binding protein [Oscillospiraceae bacterium]
MLEVKVEKRDRARKTTQVKTPWKNSMGDLPMTLSYYEGAMVDMVEDMSKQYPDDVAFIFMGRKTTYRQLFHEIETCAKALKTIGVREGDRVTIAMPNCPQAVEMFYAVNMVGAVANMIHPLSAEKEIEFFLNESESITAITLDQFYNKFENVRKNTKVVNIIIASVKDALSRPIKAGYMLTEGRKIKKIPADAPVILWQDFIKLNRCCFYNYRVRRKSDDPAVILYSGGTTGTTKGIVLTNKNFNALGQQVLAANPIYRHGDKMLAAMPLFHGFGLGVCIHTMLSQGGCCILVPRFTAKSYAKQIVKYRCNFIAGVPTLYEALLRLPSMDGADLSCLKGVFSGGDSLSIELKKKLDKFLYDHKATIQVREGYGMTETVTACCLTPAHMHKEGSIGLPFPDTFIKIVKPGTDQELPYGQEGEILLAGPTVMQGYMNQPEETAETLRTHADGLTWVYSGDLGTMDEEGFVFFKGRAKRMIVSSGYNVYPGQLENILDAHEMVQMSCVIGVPDDYKIQKVKAFVKLAAGVPANQQTRDTLMAYCRKNIAKYALPYDIEFREDMPKTLVGKVAYRILEEEELEKIKAREAEAQPPQDKQD